jgi:hypothetical protein
MGKKILAFFKAEQDAGVTMQVCAVAHVQGWACDLILTCIAFFERVNRLGAACVYGPSATSLSPSLPPSLSLSLCGGVRSVDGQP